VDSGNGEFATTSLLEGALREMVSYYFPAFLYLSLGVWVFLLFMFVSFLVYLVRLPDDEILRIHAKAIENKRRLNIKIFRF
jgi:hypothetical protein